VCSAASTRNCDVEINKKGKFDMDMSKRLGAEILGTFWLVLGGCGSAVLAAHFGGEGNPLGIGLVGVSLAFGLSVLTMAYAVGHISGGHFNPAVSVGLWAAGRFSGKDLGPYVVAQVLGGLAAARFGLTRGGSRTGSGRRHL
jgi:aquaporin Z